MKIEDLHNIFLSCSGISTDTRNIEKNSLFFALKGDNFDANKFANQAIENRAKYAVIDNPDYEIEGKTILVEDSLTTLQKLANFHRKQLNTKIIGLTGSNGKTTTKELFNVVLSKKFNTKATIGNLNNHIGVPLTLLRFDKNTEIGIVEMGANHQKEIEFLCSIAEPDFGYITNFGKAHLEGFGGFEGVINGKSELYDYLKSNNNTILVNEADAIQLEKTLDYVNKISFGKLNSHYVFEVFAKDHFVGLIYQSEKLLSNLTGNYNFTNLSAAVSLGLHFNIPFNDIKEAIESYFPSNMRSQVQKKNGKTLVLDTYNANPSSMSASLDNFNEFEGSKTIIIGDMLELGTESELEHQLIFDKAKALSFENIITVGKEFKKVNTTDLAFENTSELIAFLKEKPITTDNILLKASRGIALEKAIDLL